MPPATPSNAVPAVRWAMAWACVALALAAWCAWVLWHPPSLGHFTDSVDYLVIGEFFRGALGGDAPEQAANYFRHSRFPPLFPLVLAAAGATPDHPVPGLVLTQALALLASALFVAWYLREGLATPTAALLGLAAFACPAALYWLLTPMSEPLLLLLVGAALLRASRPAASPASLLVLAGLVGLAPIARMAGLALVVAFGAWLLREGAVARSRRALAFVVAALPAAAWIAYRSLLPIEESYLDALAPERMLNAFGGWDGVLRQPLALVDALAAAFTPFPRGLQQFAAVLLLGLAALGLPERLRRNRLDAWFTPLYLGLVLVWPYPAEATRLMLVLLPVLALQACAAIPGLRPLATSGTRGAATAVAAIAVLACLPGWWHTLQRARIPLDPELEAQRRSTAYFVVDTDDQAQFGAEILARLVALSEELPDVVPRGDCVYTLHPALVWVHSGRSVAVRVIPPEVIDGRAPLQRLRDCRFLLVANLQVMQFEVPALYPLAQLRDRLRPVLHSVFEHRGETVPAAYLFTWTDQDPQGQPP